METGLANSLLTSSPANSTETTLNPAPRRGVFAPLRIRLLLLVLLAWIPVAGLVVISSFSDRTKAIARAETELMRIVRTIAHRQQEHIDSTRQLLRALSRPRNLDPVSAERTGEWFTRILTYQKEYMDIGVVGTDGHVFARGQSDTNLLFYGDRKFFKQVVKDQKFSDSDYDLDRETTNAILYLANPITDKSGELTGILYAALRLDWVYHFAPNVDFLENATLTLIDRHDNILLRYPDSETEKNWVNESLADMPDLKQLLERDKKGWGQGRGKDGVPNVYAFTPLSSTRGIPDAWAVATIAASDVFTEAHLILVKNLTFLGLVGVLALSAAWFGGDVFVLQPVSKLARATHKIRNGTFKISTDIKHAPAELVDLAQDFGVMARSLELRIAEREKAEADLRQLNAVLEQRVEERTLELRRSNEELEQFAYIASHDLQEPLRMVISYMQLLEQRYGEKLDKNAEEFIGFAVDGAQRMQQLISALLTYSRVGTRQRPFEPTDTRDVLKRVQTNLKVAIEETNAVITHDPLPVVLGDGVQLSQLFQNLIGNAIKFHGDKPPAIHVCAQCISPASEDGAGGEKMWQFCVRDNGIGIAPENFQRIFVIFQRLHGRSKFSGTGIGLAICKKIVERHGGSIWPESEPGRGSRFYFTLPGAN